MADSRAVKKCKKKEDTQPRHVKHECTRGFERKSFQMDDTNRLADKISEIQIQPNWKRLYHTKKVEVRQAGWPSGLRGQTQEIPQSRILVHECVRGFESNSCQKTFWTRWGRAFSWQILSYWNVNSRWQCKAKENRKIATTSVVDTRAISKCPKRRIPSRDIRNTNVRVGWNAKLLKRMTQTFSRLHLWIEKLIQLKKHRSYRKKSRLARQDGRVV